MSKAHLLNLLPKSLFLVQISIVLLCFLSNQSVFSLVTCDSFSPPPRKVFTLLGPSKSPTFLNPWPAPKLILSYGSLFRACCFSWDVTWIMLAEHKGNLCLMHVCVFIFIQTRIHVNTCLFSEKSKLLFLYLHPFPTTHILRELHIFWPHNLAISKNNYLTLLWSF